MVLDIYVLSDSLCKRKGPPFGGPILLLSLYLLLSFPLEASDVSLDR